MSEKRMQRAEMWEYFRAMKVTADKIGRKKDDKDKARKHIKYECIVNGDRLIIGQWRCLGLIDTKIDAKGKKKYYKEYVKKLINQIVHYFFRFCEMVILKCQLIKM